MSELDIYLLGVLVPQLVAFLTCMWVSRKEKEDIQDYNVKDWLFILLFCAAYPLTLFPVFIVYVLPCIGKLLITNIRGGEK